MAGLEDVIAGAIAEAREDGLVGAQEGDEPIVDGGDEGAGDAGGEEAASDEGAGDEGTGETGDGVEKPAEGEEGTEEKPADGEEPPPDPKKKDEELDPNSEEALLKELGLKPRPDGRVHRIPVPRVAKILGAARVKATEASKAAVTIIGKALGVPDAELATATVETLGPKLTETLADVAELRDRVSVMDELAPIMLSDGDAFIAMLANSNPEQYGKFAAVLKEGYQPPTRTELPEEKNDPRPEPDLTVKLPDGTVGKTYSLEGQQKLEAWQERKTERKVQAALDARFKPLDDANKSARSQQARQQQVLHELNDFMSEAHQWTGFEADKDAILAETKLVDKKIPFRRAVRMAYEKVVFGKLHTDRTKMRAEILAELKKAPTSTSTTKKAGTVKPGKGEVERGEGGEVVTGSEAAIRRSLRQARASGQIK